MTKDKAPSTRRSRREADNARKLARAIATAEPKVTNLIQCVSQAAVLRDCGFQVQRDEHAHIERLVTKLFDQLRTDNLEAPHPSENSLSDAFLISNLRHVSAIMAIDTIVQCINRTAATWLNMSSTGGPPDLRLPPRTDRSTSASQETFQVPANNTPPISTASDALVCSLPTQTLMPKMDAGLIITRASLISTNDAKQETAFSAPIETAADFPCDTAGILVEIDPKTGYSYYVGLGRRILLQDNGNYDSRFVRGFRFLYNAGDNYWNDEADLQREARITKETKEFFESFRIKNENFVTDLRNPFMGYGEYPSIDKLKSLFVAVFGQYDVPLFDKSTSNISYLRDKRHKIVDLEATTCVEIIPFDYTKSILSMIHKNYLIFAPIKRLMKWIDAENSDVLPSDPKFFMYTATKKNKTTPIGHVSDEIYECDGPVFKAAALHIASHVIPIKVFKEWELLSSASPHADVWAVVEDGNSLVLSGPAGAGKTTLLNNIHKLMSEKGENAKVFRLNARELPYFPNQNNYAISAFKDLLTAAREARKSNRVTLIIDEYTGLPPTLLSQLSVFHQIIAAGDCAQSTSRTQPIFEFIRLCGGTSFVLGEPWRALNASLFNIISFLAYGGLYNCLPHAKTIKTGDISPFNVSFCLEGPQDEAVALFLAAYAARKRNTKGQRITVLTDEELSHEIIGQLKKSSDLYKYHGIDVITSLELPGYECDMLIFASAEFDRKQLDIGAMLQTLILLLGRPRVKLEVLLPVSADLNSRFTMLLQPILFTTFQGTNIRKEESFLTTWFAEAHIELGYLYGIPIIRKGNLCAVVIFSDGDAAFQLLASVKGWTVVVLDSQLRDATDTDIPVYDVLPAEWIG